MSIPAIITDKRVSITLNGRFRAFDRASTQGQDLIDALKEKPQDLDKIARIADVSLWLAQQSFGRVVLDDRDQIRLDGKVVNYIAAPMFLRILREGFDMTPITAFIERVAENPNQDLAGDLYNFCTDNQIAIDNDGYIHLFKRVDEDLRSYWGGKEPVLIHYPSIDDIQPDLLEQINSGALEAVTGEDGSVEVTVVGKIPHPLNGWIEMPRDLCDPSRQSACSVGLHACGFSYLRTYHGGAGKVLHVRINPAWITAFPYDHEAKLRCCKLEVLGVIPEQEANAYFASSVESRHEPQPVDPAPEVEEEEDDYHGYLPDDPQAWDAADAEYAGREDGRALGEEHGTYDCDPEFGARWTAVDSRGDPEISEAYRRGFQNGYKEAF